MSLFILVCLGGPESICSEDRKRAIQGPYRQGKEAGGGKKFVLLYSKSIVLFCNHLNFQVLSLQVRKHQFLPPHSTIVKFHRSWEEQGRLYQQFELCNGTLQELAETQDDIPQVLVVSQMVKFKVELTFLRVQCGRIW